MAPEGSSTDFRGYDWERYGNARREKEQFIVSVIVVTLYELVIRAQKRECIREFIHAYV